MKYALLYLSVLIATVSLVVWIASQGEVSQNQPTWSSYSPEPGIICVHNANATQPYCIERMYSTPATKAKK